jgi:glycosyltransferase involved in cell wall biosynthesis
MDVLMTVSNDVVHDVRVLKEAHTLQEAGHHVSIIGWDRSGTQEPRENRDGLAIYRVPTEGGMRLLPKDLFRLPVWWRRAQRIARSIPFDVVHCHDLDSLPIGVRLKKATGRPLVYDAHEIFGYMIETDVPKFVVDYTFRMERRLAPQADRIITVTAGVKDYIDRASGKESVLVRNCHDVVVDEYQPPPGPPFTVLYVGVLHIQRFILEAIEVIGEIPDVRLVIAGAKQLTARVRAMCAKHANTVFLGMVPSERVLPMTLESHAVLIMSDPRFRINKVGLSNKMFDAMATGRPVIVTQGLPMGEIVTREECGIAVPYTKEGFRSAVERLRDDPSLAARLGRNGLAAAKREYNWATEARKLVALYEGLERAG